MKEKRKSQRTKLDSTVIIKKLQGESAEEATVEVVDISKTGVGFTCDVPLAIAATYESFLTIWTKETLHAFLEIVRIEKREENYFYGASFVGMPELVSSRIEVYQTVEREKNSSQKSE